MPANPSPILIPYFAAVVAGASIDSATVIDRDVLPKLSQLMRRDLHSDSHGDHDRKLLKLDNAMEDDEGVTEETSNKKKSGEQLMLVNLGRCTVLQDIKSSVAQKQCGGAAALLALTEAIKILRNENSEIDEAIGDSSTGGNSTGRNSTGTVGGEVAEAAQEGVPAIVRQNTEVISNLQQALHSLPGSCVSDERQQISDMIVNLQDESNNLSDASSF
mmetsp:Transcript_68546/g.108791  ORF Transcript_68546/g.108791 Transcript_68546/m.108791 type:complete len:217 (+) Transcript_68546:86-736(+)